MEIVDPRAALADAARARGASLARLSRLLGRNAAYVQQYVARGSPRVLPERERRLLADYLGVDDEALGGPAAMRAVARFDLAASAGPGGIAEIDLPARPRRIDPALLAALGVRDAAASMIRVTGDSMLPTLHDGDEILIDGDVRSPAREGIYVIRHDGVVMVKRLRMADGAIDIVSENPAAASMPGVRADAVAVLGRVVWVSRML